MEKTYSNVRDSAHWLFGIQEEQYCTDKKTAIKFLKYIQDNYSILEIGKATTFDYSDTYMDSLHYSLFKQNKRSKKSHLSVRSRHNITTASQTFQVIHTKNKRKNIYHYTSTVGSALLSNENITFFNWMFASLEGKNPSYIPIPVMETAFTRVILYSKKRNERINIDFDITHTHIKPELWKPLSHKKMVIIETKSLEWSSHTLKKAIKKFGLKNISHTSKFLIWMNELYDLKLSQKHKKHKKRIKKVSK